MSRRLVPGLYDAVVDEAMDALLGQEPAEGVFHERLERDREAAALSLARLVHDRTLATLRGLGASDAASAVDRQVTVTNALLDRLHEISAQTTLPEDRVAQPPRRLLALVPRGSKFSAGPLATVEPPARPEVPLGVSDLMVNGRHDLRLGTELVRELASADTVDLLCSFLKYSGLRVVEDALTSFFARQGRMRVLTTAYMGATERRALGEIARLGAEVRVSYDVEHTRLHAKAWLFHRESGPSTAYVGSSNLSRAAMLDGLEWNVRLSRADNATILEKFKRVFDHYWTEAGFEPLTRIATAHASTRPSGDRPSIGVDFCSRSTWIERGCSQRAAPRRSALRHPRKVRGGVLPHHDVPRLRDLADALSLGVAERRARRHEDRRALREARAARPRDPALRAGAAKDTRRHHDALHLPRPLSLREARGRPADGDRVGARAADASGDVPKEVKVAAG